MHRVPNIALSTMLLTLCLAAALPARAADYAPLNCRRPLANRTDHLRQLRAGATRGTHGDAL
jgi:hypothetical protein